MSYVSFFYKKIPALNFTYAMFILNILISCVNFHQIRFLNVENTFKRRG